MQNLNRYTFLYYVLIIFLLTQFFSRVALAFYSFGFLDFSIASLLKTFAIGFFYDLITFTYFSVPLVLYLFIIPKTIFNHRLHRVFIFLLLFIFTYGIVFGAFSEWFFWEEFGKRFNFIAVDYLVYTHEVINNIRESYAMPLIFGIVFIITLFIDTVFIRKTKYFKKLFQDKSTYRNRLRVTLALLCLPIISFIALDKQPLSLSVSTNRFNQELAKNGIYSLFSAFRHNELAYDEFYKTVSTEELFPYLKKLEGFDGNSSKILHFSSQERKRNIILIMVESLSAEYMGIYGNKKQLTPNLDRLASKSLFFNNLFATGTRTVRGMEAVNLSIPPTPGRSIVKRPKNNTLDSIGKILQSKGYENKFIYGGHGYFDNMNDFFSGNGYRIVDRLSFKKDEISFANIWGVCDENLYNKTIQEADKSYEKNRPFFSFVMTTSNHRPYTYPEGKIDIPSHTGRDGAVKYTDFAIGDFFKKVKRKPWFDNTIFVIIADHNGGSAGKTSLPLYRYRIPLIIYSPSNIDPKIISKLSSQIDTMPTIFSLLNMDYKSKFYGHDILNKEFKERAFIGTYQKLGYVKNDILYYLTPDKKVHKKIIKNLSLRHVNYMDSNITQDEEIEVIAYYQSASRLYTLSK